jgi:hypothetical protein
MATESFADFFTGSNMTPDWWNIVLQQMPQAQYYSSPTGMDFAQQSPSRGRFFQQAYQDVYSDYLGNIGTAMRQGQAPTSFMDYMETADPWTARYSSLPQVSRGTTGMYTNPRTRFLYNF